MLLSGTGLSDKDRSPGDRSLRQRPVPERENPSAWLGSSRGPVSPTWDRSLTAKMAQGGLKEKKEKKKKKKKEKEKEKAKKKKKIVFFSPSSSLALRIEGRCCPFGGPFAAPEPCQIGSGRAGRDITPTAPGRAPSAKCARGGRVFAHIKIWRRWHHRVNIHLHRIAIAVAPRQFLAEDIAPRPPASLRGRPRRSEAALVTPPRPRCCRSRSPPRPESCSTEDLLRDTLTRGVAPGRALTMPPGHAPTLIRVVLRRGPAPTPTRGALRGLPGCRSTHSEVTHLPRRSLRPKPSLIADCAKAAHSLPHRCRGRPTSASPRPPASPTSAPKAALLRDDLYTPPERSPDPRPPYSSSCSSPPAVHQIILNGAALRRMVSHPQALGGLCAAEAAARLRPQRPPLNTAAVGSREFGLRLLDAHLIFERRVGSTAACGRNAHRGLVFPRHRRRRSCEFRSPPTHTSSSCAASAAPPRTGATPTAAAPSPSRSSPSASTWPSSVP
uniref:Uncharacterized protein n=1 Tax=Ananas comosus var. bracteatus TaxID=296719 RepID=A0A6V7PSB4_ANACO|nr:unnamed protein product [Ananas comosus var. bracteatus]